MVGKVTGKDGTVRGLKLKQGNGYIAERPLQPVCKLEIGVEHPDCQLNPEAEVFIPRLRPSRRSKEIETRESRTLFHKKFKNI